MVVNPATTLFLQNHNHQFEHYVVFTGAAKITTDVDVNLLEEGRSVHISLGAIHRLRNLGIVLMMPV